MPSPGATVSRSFIVSFQPDGASDPPGRGFGRSAGPLGSNDVIAGDRHAGWNGPDHQVALSLPVHDDEPEPGPRGATRVCPAVVRKRSLAPEPETDAHG